MSSPSEGAPRSPSLRKPPRAPAPPSAARVAVSLDTSRVRPDPVQKRVARILTDYLDTVFEELTAPGERPASPASPPMSPRPSVGARPRSPLSPLAARMPPLAPAAIHLQPAVVSGPSMSVRPDQVSPRSRAMASLAASAAPVTPRARAKASTAVVAPGSPGGRVKTSAGSASPCSPRMLPMMHSGLPPKSPRSGGCKPPRPPMSPSSARAAAALDGDRMRPDPVQARVRVLLDSYLDTVLGAPEEATSASPAAPAQVAANSAKTDGGAIAAPTKDAFRLFVDSAPGHVALARKRALDSGPVSPRKRKNLSDVAVPTDKEAKKRMRDGPRRVPRVPEPGPVLPQGPQSLRKRFRDNFDEEEDTPTKRARTKEAANGNRDDSSDDEEELARLRSVAVSFAFPTLGATE